MQQPPNYPNNEGWQTPPYTQFQPPWQQQPPYYSQPTEAFQPPPQPGMASYSFQQPVQTPPGKPKRAFTRKQWLLGCILPVTLLFLCIGSIAVVAATMPTTQAPPPPTATPTQAAILVATVTTRPTATLRPTATPKPKPTATPTPTAAPVRLTPTPTPCAGINHNPWCYDFNPGKDIYYPPSGFCTYFNCIPTFVGSDDPGDGYIIECQDGTYSQSGGESGACSSHGGEMRPLHSH